MADSLIFDGPVPSDALTWYSRELPKPAQNTLSARLFPDRKVMTPTVRLDANVYTRRRTGAFRAVDGHFRELGRDRAEVRELNFAMLGAKSNFSEYEYLQQMYAAMEGGNVKILADAMYKDAEVLVESVYNRLELAAGDLTQDGILSIREEGLIRDIDFDIDPTQMQTAPVLWDSGQEHSKLRHILDLTKQYRQVNLEKPKMVMDEDTWAMLLQDDEFKPYLSGAFGTPNVVPESTAMSIMRDLGIPEVAFFYENSMYVLNEETGQEEPQEVLPAGTIYFIPQSEAIGYTAWGISATERELINAPKTDFGYADANGVAVVEIKNQAPPFAKTIYADASALPVIDRPRGLWSLKVRNVDGA